MSKANPSPPPPPPFVPPSAKDCPPDYVSKDGGCFMFGSHSSYEMATSTCDSVGATLVNIEPSISKYIRNSVRAMGGNDFWIGSFVRNGRVYRQSGRTSCPIMRGQMINDALYGLVDCNSANRYICQKYGEASEDELDFNQDNPFVDGAFGMDSNVRRPSRLNIPSKSSSTIASTTLSSVQEGGSNNAVIYAVIAAVIIIVALIALRFICKRYTTGKKKSKNTKKAPLPIKKEKTDNTGNVFSPKSRKTESKASSIDSAVPPSNSSLEKSTTLPGMGKDHKTDDVEIARMGRPRVNGPPPTRQPPHLDDKISWTYHTRTLERPKKESEYADRARESPNRRCKRTYSDPRSDYGRLSPKEYYRGRRSSVYSEYSLASSDSEEDDDDDDDSRYGGGRRGPAKVYQRYPSQTSQRHNGTSRRQRTESSKDRYYGRSVVYGRGHRKSYNDHHTNYYHNDGFDGGRRTSRARYTAHSQRHAHKDNRRHRPPSNTVQERQYFPQPHRLMSWLDPGVLKDNVIVEPPNAQDQMRSLPREPIRINRQIYQVGNAKQSKGPKKWRKPAPQQVDQQHIYESLNEVKSTRRIKKPERKNSKKKDRESIAFKRNVNARASTRSVASIQSRKLPSPPV